MTPEQATAIANLCTTMTLHGWWAEHMSNGEWLVVRADGTFWTQGGKLSIHDAARILLENAKEV